MTEKKEPDRSVREEMVEVLRAFLAESCGVPKRPIDGMATELAEVVLDTLLVGELARRAPYGQMKWAIINRRLEARAKK